MNNYNKKCLGCGQFFSKDKNNPSYVEKLTEKTKLCKRCFQLKNYGILNNDNVDNTMIENTLEEIDFNLGSIVLVVDIFDIENSLMDKFKNNKNLLIVVNKINFFKKLKKVNEVMMTVGSTIKDLGWNQNVIFYDAVDKFKISEIDRWIKNESKKNKKVYMVGKTNVGKSSLINALLSFNKKEEVLSVSYIKNTTLNLSKIKLDKFTSVIDTPGYSNDKNFLSICKSENKINFKKMVFKNYALKDNNQIFFLEDVAKIYCETLYEGKPNSIQFFVPDNFIIHRTNVKNLEKIENKKDEIFAIHLDNNEGFKINQFKDLKEDCKFFFFINGLGIVSFKNIKNIKIEFPKNIDVRLFEKSII